MALCHDRRIMKFRIPSSVWQALAIAMGCAWTPLASPAPFEDTMAQRMVACTACHGPQGRAAPDGYYPRLAGKPAGYLYNQLLNFRDGQRNYRLMSQMVDPLSDAYLLEIAEHFAAQDVPYPAPSPVQATPAERARGEQLVLRGDASRQLPACASCHGTALTGVLPATPGLLGLPRDYLNAQLGAWRTGLRKAHAPDCMAEVARRLAPEDIAAVSAWLASQPVPARAHAVRFDAAPLPMRCGSAVPPGARP
jgi:cytochrome c553